MCCVASPPSNPHTATAQNTWNFSIISALTLPLPRQHKHRNIMSPFMSGTFAFVYRNRPWADGEGGLPRPGLAGAPHRHHGYLVYFDTKIWRRTRSLNAAYTPSHLLLHASTDLGYMGTRVGWATQRPTLASLVQRTDTVGSPADCTASTMCRRMRSPYSSSNPISFAHCARKKTEVYLCRPCVPTSSSANCAGQISDVAYAILLIRGYHFTGP